MYSIFLILKSRLILVNFLTNTLFYLSLTQLTVELKCELDLDLFT